MFSKLITNFTLMTPMLRVDNRYCS